MNTKIACLLVVILLCNLSSAQIFDPNDPIIDYDESNIPSKPATNIIAKWVRTSGVSWDTDKWKCYYVNGMPFRLRFPNNYDPNKSEKYPIALILHGLGYTSGTIYENERHLGNSGASAYEDAINDNRYDGFVVSPASTGGWFSDTHIESMEVVLDQIVEELNVDENRVIINGRSGGSQNSWLFVQKHPETYAGLIPMSGVKASSTDNLEALKYVPVWVFQGELDDGPAPATTEAHIANLNSVNANVRYSYYKSLGHGIFDVGYAEDDYFGWIESLSKTTPTIHTGQYTSVYNDEEKIIYEFVKKTQPCPNEVIDITLGLTAGFANYEWRKNGEIIEGANANEYQIHEIGTYEARFKKEEDDEWSDWSLKPIVITEKEPTTTPDIQIDGNLSSVLPSVDGNVSIDLALPQGFADYEWRKVSDSSIVSTERTVTVSDPDKYVAKVTENFGCSSSFSNPFQVVDANGANGPQDPLSFNGLALSKTEIQLIWTINLNDLNPALNFELFRSKEGDDLELIVLLDSTFSAYTDSGLDPDTYYTYYLRSFNENGASQTISSPEIETLVDAVSPTTPNNLTIVSSNSYSATLDWDDATDDVGVYRYDVYKDGIKVLSTEDSEVTVYNLLSNSIYKFHVTARDITGNTSALSERVIVVTSLDNDALSTFTFEEDYLDVSNNNTQINSFGNPTFSSDSKEGLYSVSFDGNGDYLSIDESNMYIHDEFSHRSIAFWMKSGDLNGTHDIFEEGGATSGFSIRTAGNTIDFAVQDQENLQSITSAITIDTDWHHIGAVFNEGSMVLYIDGVEVGRNDNLPFSLVSSHNNAAGLGGTNGGNAFDQTSNNFIGNIDDFHVYDIALNSTDILTLMDPEEKVSIPNNIVEAPSDITATSVSYESIELTWVDNSSSEIAFQVFRQESGHEYVPIAHVEDNTTSYLDTGLKPETTYFYKVVALTEYNESQTPTSSLQSLVNLNFDDSLNDDSGNAITTSITGNIAYSGSDYIEGTSAVSFNGDSYISIDEGNSFIHDEFSTRTISFWFKSNDSEGIQDVFEEGGTTSGIGVRLNDDSIELAVQNDNVIHRISAPVSRSKWHHFVGSFDNGSLEIYIDGNLLSQTSDLSYSTVAYHSNGGGLGGSNAGNAFDQTSDRFNGLIDAFYVFNTGADVTLVDDLYNLSGYIGKTTTDPLPNAPVAVYDLTIASIGHTEITLTFTDALSNEDYFEVYRSINNEQNYQSIDTIINPGSSSVTYIDNGLTTNVKYFYKVASVNVGGFAESPSVSAYTLNHDPAISSEIAGLSMHYGTVLELPILASDEDNNPLVITGNNIPSFGEIIDYGDGSGKLRFSPDSIDQGTYQNIIIKVNDEFGGIDSIYFELIVNSNSIPTITAIEDVTIKEGDSLSIPFNIADEEGANNLYWTSELPSFATLIINYDGTASVDLAPSHTDNGTYLALINIEDVDGAKAKEEFIITVSDVNPNSFVWINMVNNTVAPEPWNNISSTDLYHLNDTEGDSSGISFQLQTTTWKSYNQGSQTGNDSGIMPDAVLKDYYYFGIFGAPETVDINLSGLQPETFYNLSFLASSAWTGTADNGTTIYTIDGQSEHVYAQNNTQNTADFFNVQADSIGQLLVTMSKMDDGTPVGYLNGMKIETVLGIDEIPANPRSLATELTNSAIHLSWIDAPFNEDGYKIYRSNLTEGTYSLIDSTESNTEAYIDPSISQGQEYFYKITAYNNIGESGFSNIASYTVPNIPPSITLLDEFEKVFVNDLDTLSFYVEDLPANNFSVSILDLPDFATFNDDSFGGDIIFNALESDIGIYEFTIVATDDMGAITELPVHFEVEKEILFSISLNFNNNYSGASPWNNTNKAPAINDVFSNLKDENGEATSTSVTLLTSFGGVYDETTVTGDNSGIVPDNVLKEYYWWGIYGAPDEVQMKVSGLDYNNKYTFKFVAGSTFSGSGIIDNGETNFSIGNQTANVYVQGNTAEFGTIENVTADINGEVIITITKGNGASAGFVNALIIESYEGDPSIFYPGNLTASALSESSIKLNWSDNSFDETQFEIEKSSSSEGPFSTIGTVSANQTEFIETGLDRGSIQYYRVRALYDNQTYSGYTDTITGATISYYVYVNINGVPAYDEATPWNNLSIESGSGDVFTGFYNQDGNPTGISMEIIEGMQGSNDWGAITGDDSGVFPDNVMQSFYFNDRFEDPGHFKLFGLDAGFDYNLKFFGSIVTGYDITTNFTAGGQTVSNYQTNNTEEVASIYGLEASNDGALEFIVQEAPNSTWAIFNAFVLEAYPKSVNSEFAFRASQHATDPETGYQVNFGKSIMMVSHYPNPINDYLKVLIENAPTSEATISIIDLMGKTIVSRSVSLDSSASNVTTISENIKELENGVYLLSVEVGEKRFINRIMKK